VSACQHDPGRAYALRVIEEADRLYGLPLEDFIAQRDALAKSLRGEGRRAEADEVKALRKPPAVVWAVNQVMRTQGKAARALAGAADRAAANPGDRDALAAHAAALDELTKAAAGLLSGKGRALSEDALLRVRSALHAASLDRELRDEFVAGRLSAEPAPAGFGALTGMPAPAPAAARPKPAVPKKAAARKKAAAPKKAAARAKPAPPPPPPRAPRPSAAARKRVERAETKVGRARERLAAAEQELADARAALEVDQG
jgi:hypothetical protein